MSAISIKRNDVGVTLTATLKASGDPVDLTGIDSVAFIMRMYGADAPKVEATAEVTNAEAGEVRYITSDGDLDTAGIYRVEWEVTFSPGRIETFPSEDWDSIAVKSDLNPPEGS